MTDPRALQRIIAADIGRSLTRACLLANVEGRYRLAAVSAAPTHMNDSEQGIAAGLVQAVIKLEQIVQVPLLDREGRLPTFDQNSHAAAALVVSSSAAEPLRIVILGVSRSFSIASALRACYLPFVSVAATYELDLRSVNKAQPAWEAVLADAPDAIVLAGGFDGSPPEVFANAALRVAELYGEPGARQQPRIICAASQATIQAVIQAGATLDVRGCTSVRPAPDVEHLQGLQNELIQAYEELKLASLPGFSQLAACCIIPLQASCRALKTISKYLARQGGADRAMLIAQDGVTTSLVQRTPVETRCCGSLSETIRLQTQDALYKRWLPLGISDEEQIIAYARSGNNPKALSQASLTLADLAYKQQALCSCVRTLGSTGSSHESAFVAGDIDLLAVSGASADTAAELLALLNTVQPHGATRIMLDTAGILLELGAAAALCPQAAADVLDHSALYPSAICIAPLGLSAGTRQVLQMDLVRASGAVEHLTIPAGVIRRVLYPAAEVLQIHVRCARGWVLNGNDRSLEIIAPVGQLGIIIDTRGRPLGIDQAGLLWRARIADDLLALTAV